MSLLKHFHKINSEPLIGFHVTVSLYATFTNKLRKILTLAPLVLMGTFSFSQDTISFYNFDIDAGSGWTTGASGLNGASDNRSSWAVGVPKGGQGYNNIFFQWSYEGNLDPTTDHTANNTTNRVIGQGLGTSNTQEGVSAYYTNSNEWVQSPAINCENNYNVNLSFWRWANIEPDYDFGYVEISNDGINWTQLSHPTSMQDTDWTFFSIDISQYADWQQQVYVRWRTESDGWVYYSGWNIDDVLITGKTTNNNHDSRITGGIVTPPSIISSLTDTYEERIDIGSFSITDAGSGDNLPTIIDTLVLTSGSSNTIENWKKTSEIYLYSPAFTTLENNQIKGLVKKGKVYFVGNGLLSIADGTTEDFVIRMNLKKDLSELTDNQNFEFELIHANQKINQTGSYIGTGYVSTGNNNLIVDINATELRFISSPEPLQAVSREILPVVEVAATDENGNIDVDYASSISIFNSLGLAMRNKKQTAVNGVATFANMQFTEVGGPVTLTTTHKGASTISNTICNVQVTIQEDIDNGFFFDNFDDTGITGWTTGATGLNGASDGRTSWTVGNPNGGIGLVDLGFFVWNIGNPDPTKDRTQNNINNVYGQGLGSTSQTAGVASHYGNSSEWLMSPAINCADYYNVKFSFFRWANFETNYDTAFVEISTDGSNWTKLDHPQFPQDESWVKVSFDISAIADRQEIIYIRWRSSSNENVHYSGWNIDNVNLNGIYSPATDWVGNVSKEWGDVNNWSGGVLPNELSNITIPADARNFPEVNISNAICNQLTISAGASIVINDGASLSVYGDLILETTSTTYGSLIDNGNLTVYGQGRMSRTISGNQWHYISSPFSNTNTNLYGTEVYRYDEVIAANNWLYGWVQVADEIMQPGTGYDVYITEHSVIEMSGQFNTGNYAVNVTNTDGVEVAEHEGWNMIGNPYPSAIDWDASGWTKSNINNAIYIWDKEQQNYVTYISGVGANGGTNYIPPMQGFFIKVTNPGTGILTMNNNVRVANTQSKLKATGTQLEGLNIRLSSNNYFDETVVRLIGNASSAYDNGLDAEKKFTSNKKVPQIYTKSATDINLTINTLGLNDEYIKIPLYITVNEQGTYTLNIDGANNLDYRKTVYLEDLVSGEMIDLYNTNQLIIESKKVKDYERFVLHIGMPLQIKYKVTHVSEAGGTDGNIDLTIMGGYLPIADIKWSNGSTSEDLDNIIAGNYTVIVTDNNNNSVTETITVMHPGEDGNLTGLSDELSNENLVIYSTGRTVIIRNDNELFPIDDITIYSVTGRVVYSNNEVRTDFINIELTDLSGLYIVKVNQAERNTSGKIILK